jgi:hypothetical protein
MTALCLVALRIKKQLIKESVDGHVNIMAQKKLTICFI